MKKKTKEAVIPTVPPIQLTELELKSLDLHEARAQAQMNIKDKFILEERLLSIDYQNKRDEIRRKQAEAIASMEEAKKDYNDTIKAIEARLNIVLKDYAIDVNGGLVYMKDN